jgi:hypothetical protein
MAAVVSHFRTQTPALACLCLLECDTTGQLQLHTAAVQCTRGVSTSFPAGQLLCVPANQCTPRPVSCTADLATC